MKTSLHLRLALALCLGAYHVVAQVSFPLSASPYIGSFVRSVTAADLNRDGKMDLIAVRGSASTLVIYTNNGGGVMVSNTTYSVGSFPYQVIAADVNNDGWPDLITANSSGKSLTVLTNNGAGGFVLAATLAQGSPSAPHSVAAADFNGDGRLDLVCANALSASYTVWTNGGSGSFVFSGSFSVGTAGSTTPQWVVAVDINDDGKPDIIGVNNGSGTYLNIWTNNGNGGFAAATAPYISSGQSCATATDVNGDGKTDLILLGSQVTVVTNNGTGGFAVAGSNATGTSPYAVVAADVNGDGAVDAVTCNQGNNTLTVLTNNGGGILGSNATLNVGSGPEALTAADVSGDGRVDLVSGNWNDGTLTVLTNAATFLPRLTLKPVGNTILVSWPAIWANWTLKQASSLDSGAWTSFSGAIGNDGTLKTATNSWSTTNCFFWLSNP